MPVPGAPQLIGSSAPLLREIPIIDEQGQQCSIPMPVERPLAVLLDGRKVVTLWTLGASAAWLVLGYLLNQRLIGSITELKSVTIDWDAGTASVTRRDRAPEAGSVPPPFWSDHARADDDGRLQPLGLPPLHAPRIAAATLLQLIGQAPREDSVYHAAGSVHGCALFRGAERWVSVEDVGRRNTIDTVTGWMALHGVEGQDKILVITGRLTVEALVKAALHDIPVVVAGKGVTASCCDLAAQLGMVLVGRAARGRYVCYAGGERIDPGS